MQLSCIRFEVVTTSGLNLYSLKDEVTRDCVGLKIPTLIGSGKG